MNRSLRQKLVIRNTAILLAAISVILTIFIFFSVQESQRQIKRIQEKHEASLIEKGTAMVLDKGISLRVHVEDLSVTTIQQVVQKNLEDSETVFGGFIEANYLPWAWVDEKNPVEVQTDAEMKNPTTEWALKLEKPGYRIGDKVIEFAAPVYINPDDTGEDELGGAIIYGLTTEPMKREVENEQREYYNNLRKTLLVSGLLFVCTLMIAFILTRRQAATITQPLAVLTSAADTIAGGNYNIEVEVTSGDEIEDLAMSFNQMVKDLDSTYADLHLKNKELEEARTELEDLNKHLEGKVEDRTRKLAESESKFRTLFEKSADAILLGNEQEFFDCNPAMLKMMGCGTKEEFLRMSPYEISPEDQPDRTNSAEALHEYYQKALTVGSQHFEWVNKKIDGTEFFTEIVVTSFPLNGKQVLHKVFRDITERKRTEAALEEAQKKLVETAHSAGMAEIATGVLHNIGNILNSVNISTEEIGNTLKSSKLKNFIKANEMVRQNFENIVQFFDVHPKGKLIPGYYISIGETIEDEHRVMQEEIKALTNKVSMMRDVISTQQNYAKASLYTEDVVITDIIEDAIKLQISSLNKQGVRINRQYNDRPTGMVPKVKLVHVLTNLIKNGKEAMAENERANLGQEMLISLDQIDENIVEIKITDSGCGIEKANLDKIFNHGFTTKEQGHGFGLHTCANFMTEMGGSLIAQSDGPGSGSVFVVRFPLVCKDVRNDGGV